MKMSRNVVIASIALSLGVLGNVWAKDASIPYRDTYVGPAYIQKTPLSFSAEDLDACLKMGTRESEKSFWCNNVPHTDETAALRSLNANSNTLNIPTRLTLSLSNGCTATNYNFDERLSGPQSDLQFQLILECPSALPKDDQAIRSMLQDFSKKFGTRFISWINKDAHPGDQAAKLVRIAVPLNAKECVRNLHAVDTQTTNSTRSFECTLSKGKALAEIRKLGGWVIATSLEVPSLLKSTREKKYNVIYILPSDQVTEITFSFLDGEMNSTKNRFYADNDPAVKEEFARVLKKQKTLEVEVLVPNSARTTFPSAPASVYQRNLNLNLTDCISHFESWQEWGGCEADYPIPAADIPLLVLEYSGGTRKTYTLSDGKTYEVGTSIHFGREDGESVYVSANTPLANQIGYGMASDRMYVKNRPGDAQIKELIKRLHVDVSSVSAFIVK